MNFLKTLGGFVGSNAMGGLPFVPDAPVAGDDSGGVYDQLPDFQLLGGRSRAEPALRVSIFKARGAHAQLAQNALRRLKTLRHPNVLAFVDGAEVAATGVVLIVTEPVVPLAVYLAELRARYGAGSDEFNASVAWGLRSVLLALQFITGDCKLLHGRLNPHSIFVTKVRREMKRADWTLMGRQDVTDSRSRGAGWRLETRRL